MLLDLLEISRISADDPPQWESADLAALCRDVAAQRGVDPRVVVGDEPVVRTDARRLERIIGNLMDNAQQHAGGVVQVLLQRDAGSVRILVDDAGPGIDEGIRERLFEPFTRGESHGHTDGAGLGLAIVREQAVILGGDVTVETSPAGGARFVATLPISEAAS
jgi:signal transduction histidine kinase